MTDLSIRTEGRAGRITLTRPKALNAMNHAMGLEIERTLETWETDPAIEIVLIDAEGDKAFCAGGDIAAIHAEAARGEFGPTRRFWSEEYRLNARIKTYPKPVVTFLQGYTMGGGVGLGCHAGYRIVDETSRIAMPECGIGLVPDAGGSLILAHAPGRLGEYLGTTGSRMDAASAILAGFADHHVPGAEWDGLKDHLIRDADPTAIDEAATDPGESALTPHRDLIDAAFDAPRLSDTLSRLQETDGDFAAETAKVLGRISPLSGELALALIRENRHADGIEAACEMEYRCTHRLIEHGDLVEGIRAQVIDKDRSPRWRHAKLADVTQEELDAFLAPLGSGAI